MALDGHDIGTPETATSHMSGADRDTPVVGVSRRGFARIAREIAQVTGQDVLDAFAPGV